MLLVVDDDPVFLEQARELLDPGKGIFLAPDATRARELLDLLGTGLTVAMVDLDLPGEDGFTLIRDMRRRFPELKIIAISGVYQEHVLESAKALGASAALHKPITAEWNAAIAGFRSS
jgi:two-component system cell cycle sensor histidine kinase/response regulator CckA